MLDAVGDRHETLRPGRVEFDPVEDGLGVPVVLGEHPLAKRQNVALVGWGLELDDAHTVLQRVGLPGLDGDHVADPQRGKGREAVHGFAQLRLNLRRQPFAPVHAAANGLVCLHRGEVSLSERGVVSESRAPRLAHPETDRALAIWPCRRVHVRDDVDLPLLLVNLEIEVSGHRRGGGIQDFQEHDGTSPAQAVRREREIAGQGQAGLCGNHAAFAPFLHARVPQLPTPRLGYADRLQSDGDVQGDALPTQ